MQHAVVASYIDQSVLGPGGFVDIFRKNRGRVHDVSQLAASSSFIRVFKVSISETTAVFLFIRSIAPEIVHHILCRGCIAVKRALLSTVEVIVPEPLTLIAVKGGYQPSGVPVLRIQFLFCRPDIRIPDYRTGGCVDSMRFYIADPAVGVVEGLVYKKTLMSAS